MLFLLWACAPQQLKFSGETLGCEDLDFSDESQESELVLKTDGSDLLVSRTLVYQNCDAEFAPIYKNDGDKIHIREYWETNDTSCQTCFQPTVRIIDGAGLDLEFWWYLGDESNSFNLIQTEE
jgi:hypothetical protein